MSEYIIIPRGAEIDTVGKKSSLIIQRYIGFLGKNYGAEYTGMTAYARGKTLIADCCGVSKCVVKNVYKIHFSPKGSLANDNFSYISRFHKTGYIVVLQELLSRIPTDKENFYQMVEEIAPGQYSEESDEFDILFENSAYWILEAKHFIKEMNYMNKHNKSYASDYIKLVTDLSRIGGEKYE